MRREGVPATGEGGGTLPYSRGHGGRDGGGEGVLVNFFQLAGRTTLHHHHHHHHFIIIIIIIIIIIVVDVLDLSFIN